MDPHRREEILAAYALHASIFDEVARRRALAAAAVARHGDPSADEHVAPSLGLVTAGESPESVLERLTDRMRQVLRLVAEGHTNEEIAGHLRIGQETVKYYLKRVLVTLDARNRAHAVATAFRLGLFETPADAEIALFEAQQPRAIVNA